MELADLLTGEFGREMINPNSGRHLRSHAVQAGFMEVRIDGEIRMTTDREQGRRIALRQVEDRLAALVDDGVVSRARADAYLADQDARAASGRYQVSTVVYVMSARKPDTAGG